MRAEYYNILLIAATNRGDSLDAALLRPGRFDRRLYFDVPTKHERRDLIDFFLTRKAHEAELDTEDQRDRVASETFGYTPVMIEHLFDEALLVALRDGRREMRLRDVMDAKFDEEVGLKQTTAYTDFDREAVATHEAGHATVAYFLGKGRRLEVLSIIKRRGSLGLLAHGDEEERLHAHPLRDRERASRSRSAVSSPRSSASASRGTGPASDLAHATGLAAQMVGSFGMAGSLISYEAVADGPLSQTNLVAKVLGEHRDQAEGRGHPRRRSASGSRAVLDENRDVHAALRRGVDRARRARPRRHPRGHREGDREPSLTHACGGAGRRLAA